MRIILTDDVPDIELPDDPRAAEFTDKGGSVLQEDASGWTVLDARKVAAVVVGELPEEFSDRQLIVWFAGKRQPEMFHVYSDHFEDEQAPDFQLRPDDLFGLYLAGVNKTDSPVFHFRMGSYSLAVDLRKAVAVRFRNAQADGAAEFNGAGVPPKESA